MKGMFGLLAQQSDPPNEMKTMPPTGRRLQQPMPMMQRLAQTAKFVDHRNPPPPGEWTNNSPEVEMQTEDSLFHPLDPHYKGPAKAVPKPQPIDRNGASGVANLLGGAKDEDEDEDENEQEFKPSKKRIGGLMDNSGILGGIAVSGDAMYRTTTQAQNEGEAYADGRPKTASKKKSLTKFDPNIDLISPITGEKIADYGNWAKKYEVQEVAENSDEEEEEDDDPIMTKVRNAMEQRGAKGIIGLARLFRIMDDDGNNTLDLKEFKKAMKQLKLKLQDTEVLIACTVQEIHSLVHSRIHSLIHSLKHSLTHSLIHSLLLFRCLSCLRNSTAPMKELLNIPISSRQ